MARERFDIRRLEQEEEEYRITVRREERGRRLDVVLGGRFKWLSRSAAKRNIEAGRVTFRSAAPAGPKGQESRQIATKPSHRVEEGDSVVIRTARSPQDLAVARRKPPEKELAILFEDDDLIAVDKPSGLPVHPVGINVYRTVLTALHRHCLEKGDCGDRLPILAHRLDLETSGVLLAVKGKTLARNVADQFRRRTVRKEYVALVYGALEPDEGVIDLPLGPAIESRVPYKQAVRDDGAAARTRYRVEHRGHGTTLVRLTLETGRKHQLRVHLAALGHAIVGDKIYGPSEEYYFKAREGPPVESDLAELLLPRLALHSAMLVIRHPRTGEEVRFESPIPAELEIYD